jgi:ABC-type amino acid transport substrate-binding protein
MLDYTASFWPSGVPRTLWQFDLLTPDARPNFPLVGIEVSLEFVSAFLAGALLICIFAWRRFSEPAYNVGTEAFRDFKDLTIWSLKDGYSLRRAYMIYCLALVFIFATLAFFGRVIFQLASQFQVAGLQVNVGTVAFDSWQWPLFLALGIAGFAPLINPLVPVESWLRRFSHEVVGIPTRLQEKCLRLKTLIDGDASVPAEVGDPPAWWERQLGPKLAGALTLRQNLGAVVAWSNAEHLEWSDPDIRRKLDAYERAACDDAEAALAEFDYLTRRDAELERDLASHPERLKDCEARLSAATEKMERVRDRLAIVLAIYCENGAAFRNMPNGRLKQAIEKNFVDREELPATGLPLYTFIVVFIVYFVAISSQWHSLISAVPMTPSTVAVSAAMETLKVFTVVWLPLVVATTFSTVVLGPRPRVTANSRGSRHEVLWGTVPGAVGVFVVALVALTLVSILFAALPTDSLERMRQSLFGTGTLPGVLLSFLKLSPIAIICFVFVNAVRQPEEEPNRRVVFTLALGAASSSLVYMILMTNSSYSEFPCKRILAENQDAVVRWAQDVVFPVRFLDNGFQLNSLQACFSLYSATNIVVIAMAAFFSTFGLARSRRTNGVAPTEPDRRAHGSVIAGAAVLASLALLPVAGTAQQYKPEDDPNRVTLGFRTDVQPFSYVAGGMLGDGSTSRDKPRAGRPYVGYVAELCYQIFGNSGYEVEQISVTAQNRFDLMRRPGEEGTDKVDVLCDATTLRLDDPSRTDAGVFSPIIFVSGVSYVTRSVRRFGVDVELGFARGTTARGVVEVACEADVLQLGVRKGAGCKPPERIDGRIDCRLTRVPLEPWRQTPSLAELSDKAPSYVMCAMDTHDELIEWFCSENGRDKAYFGDREIILAKLGDWLALGRPCAGVRDPVQSFTYEPYALLISKDDPELIAFVQQRVYELFSHRSGIEALFAKWFDGQNMSPALAWLYVLNGVMQEERLLSGPKDNRTPGAAAAAVAE